MIGTAHRQWAALYAALCELLSGTIHGRWFAREDLPSLGVEHRDPKRVRLLGCNCRDGCLVGIDGKHLARRRFIGELGRIAISSSASASEKPLRSSRRRTRRLNGPQALKAWRRDRGASIKCGSVTKMAGCVTMGD